jgi:hypothetical protein
MTEAEVDYDTVYDDLLNDGYESDVAERMAEKVTNAKFTHEQFQQIREIMEASFT